MAKLPLKSYRLMQMMSQKELSKLVGTTPVTIRNWETGKTSPTVVQAEKLAAVFGVCMEDIDFLCSKS